jgi:hypothetical protein
VDGKGAEGSVGGSLADIASLDDLTLECVTERGVKRRHQITTGRPSLRWNRMAYLSLAR